ncbi:hypothetical protein NOVOSPHI9U_40739 [Novosphingobium sp. 9U]|nr:hypothetical protein NOVOSPHI9U_40739 [Novosphingobium sp. 9U]
MFLLVAERKGWWTGLDSNQRTLARADLQSAAFNHSATCPHRFRGWRETRRTVPEGSASPRGGANAEASLACQWGDWQGAPQSSDWREDRRRVGRTMTWLRAAAPGEQEGKRAARLAAGPCAVARAG